MISTFVETAVIAKKAIAINPKKTFLVFIVKEFLVIKMNSFKNESRK